jgi:RNA polymerase sigma factor (sigma-70 family)
VTERDSNSIFADYITADEGEAYKFEQELIAELKRYAYAICLLTLKQPRKDIVEESIQKALTHAKKFRNDSKFSTWFHAIVKNLCMSAQKSDLKRRSRGEVSMEDLEDSDPESNQDVEAETTAQIDLERVTEGLGELERQVLHLRMQGLSETEIAKELTLLHKPSIPFNKQRVQRIFRRIKKKCLDKIMGNIGE